MCDILCMYYSRSGNTRKAVQNIAEELQAECVELTDSVQRMGLRGWIRCGLDAVRKSTVSLKDFSTQQPLSKYKLVILGTPVWAGRCSAIMRAFLKEHGQEIFNAAYIITRSGSDKYEQVYRQMDQYLPENHSHQAAISLRSGDVGLAFWQKEFVQEILTLINKKL